MKATYEDSQLKQCEYCFSYQSFHNSILKCQTSYRYVKHVYEVKLLTLKNRIVLIIVINMNQDLKIPLTLNPYRTKSL